MKKKYVIGLPVCFVLAFGATFLVPKTYKSTFSLNQETEFSGESGRSMMLNRPENYDLGISRTVNCINAYGYSELILSDLFVRNLLDIPVQTVDGKFNGTYFDYQQNYARKTPFEWLVNIVTAPLRLLSNSNDTIEADIQGNASLTTSFISRKRDAAKEKLANDIETDVDYETSIVTVTCYAQDPLVSYMIATAVIAQLHDHVEAYEADKMQKTLTQLQAIVAQAKTDYLEAQNEQERREKKAIYDSFNRQTTVYQAQMMDIPAFVTIAEPSFSYRKDSPNRFKFAVIMTILLAMGFWANDHRTKIREFLLK